MRNRMQIKICLLLTICTFYLYPLQATATTSEWNPAFQIQIDTWIDGLAKKDLQFHDWVNTTTQVTTLEPYSHQWLVSVMNHEKNVGYLVVTEREQNEINKQAKLVLLEYGLGEHILFDDNYAPQNENITQVYDGFASYWVSIQNDLPQYIDAKTGERYPSLVKPSPAVMPTLPTGQLLSSKQNIQSVYTLSINESDPFEQIDWLLPTVNSKNTILQWKTLTNVKNTNNVVIIASLFQNEVIAPFTIGSLHVWQDDIAYIGVWDDGLRFLPAAYLEKVAQVYENN